MQYFPGIQKKSTHLLFFGLLAMHTTTSQHLNLCSSLGEIWKLKIENRSIGSSIEADRNSTSDINVGVSRKLM